MTNIIAFFTEKGTPKTGLSPKINIWKLDGTLVINAAAMTETAGGFYFYNFAAYDSSEDYAIRADSVTLTGSDRYVFGSNQGVNADNALKILKNKMIINKNIMTIYDDDGTTVLYTWDLKDRRGAPSSKEVYQRIP